MRMGALRPSTAAAYAAGTLAALGACAALIAANISLPPPLTYLDQMSENDPFYVGLQTAARLSWWGAVASGMAAVSSIASAILQARGQ